MALLSVIVPVYNVENYLERCLQSIEKQMFRDFEVILIDDGSLDGSGKICDQWCETYGQYRVIHKKNGGVSTARNIGIDAASGKYIMFIDPDDYIFPQCFEKMVGMAESEQAEFVHCDYVGPKERLLYDAPYRIDDENFYETQAGSTVWSNLFLTEHIRSNGLKFREDIHSGEDTLYVTQYYLSIKKTCGLPDKLYYYEQGSGGITQTGFSKKRLSIVDAMEELVTITRERPIMHEWAKRLLAGKTLSILFMLWKCKDNQLKKSMKSQEKRMISILREHRFYLFHDAISTGAKIKLMVLLTTPNVYKLIWGLKRICKK